MKKYICIHCKKEFNEIPKMKKNECVSAYKHDIVNKDYLKDIIITRDEVTVGEE